MLINNMTVGDVGEFGLIDKIKTLIPKSTSNDIVLHIGDDTAAIRINDKKLLLITCDIQLENQHFRLDTISPYDLGRRAISINLSDIAAMGGKPTYIMISLGLPAQLPYQDFSDLYQGFIDQSAKFDAIIVGGNISKSHSSVIIDITLLGEIEADELIKRDGARPGDHIYITGDPGFSGTGLKILRHFGNDYPNELSQFVMKHLIPEPRVQIGQEIASGKLASAMIDISDGLASDLGHICQASQTGAVLFMDKFPGHDRLKVVQNFIDLDIIHTILNAGEDYELLFTVPPTMSTASIRKIEERTGVRITEIGEIVDRQYGYWLVDGNGQRHPLLPLGWDHFKSTG